MFKNDSLKLYSRPGESRRISPRGQWQRRGRRWTRPSPRCGRRTRSVWSAGGPGQGREPSGGPRGDRRIETDRGVVVRGRGHHRVLFGGRKRSNPLGQAARRRSAASQARLVPKMRRPPDRGAGRARGAGGRPRRRGSRPRGRGRGQGRIGRRGGDPAREDRHQGRRVEAGLIPDRLGRRSTRCRRGP